MAELCWKICAEAERAKASLRAANHPIMLIKVRHSQTTKITTSLKDAKLSDDAYYTQNFPKNPRLSGLKDFRCIFTTMFFERYGKPNTIKALGI